MGTNLTISYKDDSMVYFIASITAMEEIFSHDSRFVSTHHTCSVHSDGQRLLLEQFSQLLVVLLVIFNVTNVLEMTFLLQQFLGSVTCLSLFSCPISIVSSL